MKDKIKRNLSKIIIAILSIIVLATSISLYLLIKNNNLFYKINLPSYSYIDLKDYGFTDEYITITGSFESEDESNKVSSKLNTIKIICDKTSDCKLMQAEIFMGNLLSIYDENFDIVSWDQNFIVFKTQDTKTKKCVEWTYRIDRVKKELIGVREKVSNYDYEFCKGMGENKFNVKVSDGWEVVSKLRGYK